MDMICKNLHVIVKTSIKKFNTQFDNIIPTNCKHIMHKKNVEPYSVPKSLAFTTLGEDVIHDFSGNNDDTRSLHYTDYNIAYSTTKLAHPTLLKSHKSHTANNLEEVKKARENMDLNCTSDELYEYNKYVRKLKKREDNRIRIIEKQDKAMSNNFLQSNKIVDEYRLSNQIT
jgi:hypothetical protein